MPGARESGRGGCRGARGPRAPGQLGRLAPVGRARARARGPNTRRGHGNARVGCRLAPGARGVRARPQRAPWPWQRPDAACWPRGWARWPPPGPRPGQLEGLLSAGVGVLALSLSFGPTAPWRDCTASPQGLKVCCARGQKGCSGWGAWHQARLRIFGGSWEEPQELAGVLAPTSVFGV